MLQFFPILVDTGRSCHLLRRCRVEVQGFANEVLLIKGWDSLDDGRARFTPHSAFHMPEMRENAPARESIEVRTFVVIE